MAGGNACGQEIERGSAPAGLVFGAAIGMPGQEVTLSLSLTNSGQMRIGRLSMEIGLPSSLSLVRTETAYPAERAGARISTDTAESKIRFKIASPTGSPEGLPAGSIAFLTFKISDDAQEGKLRIEAGKIEMLGLNDQPVGASEKSEGLIDVVPREMEPLFACYFYMH